MIQKLPITLKHKILEEHRMVLTRKGIQWPSGEMIEKKCRFHRTQDTSLKVKFEGL
jgi:hypothetical protein